MFVSYIIHEYDKKTCHCLTLSQQRVVVTIQYIDGTFLKKKTTNNLFFFIYNTTTIKTSEQQETPFKQVFWYVQL